MTVKKILNAIALATLLTGCVSVQATRLGSAKIYAATTPDKVYIYRTAAQVHGKYEEIGILSASGDYEMTSEEEMFKAMREKAAELGANGVILDSLSEPTTGSKIAQALLFTSADRQGKAIAIRVLEPSN